MSYVSFLLDTTIQRLHKTFRFFFQNYQQKEIIIQTSVDKNEAQNKEVMTKVDESNSFPSSTELTLKHQ